jgi:hypothetical protein
LSLREEHRKAVTAEIPAGVEVPPDFWRDLEAAIETYSAMNEQRAGRLPASELKRYQRIESLAHNLGHEIGMAKRRVRWTSSDPHWPDRALTALREIKRKAEAALIAHEMISAGFKGRRNQHRANFYADILDLWVFHLGQEIKYSTASKTNLPGGPLIRFIKACVDPVLGNGKPTPHTVADIIDREKNRRRKGKGVLGPPKNS